MDGELIEKRIILPYKECEEDMEGFFTFDVDIVQFMMAEKGLDIKFYTIDKIRKIFDEWIEKFDEFQEFENKYNLNYNEVCFRKIFKFEPKTDYDGADVDHFIELGDFIFHNPVFEVLKEYRKLFNIAYHNDLLSPVIDATNSGMTESSHIGVKISVMKEIEAVKVLKYTSKKLDRIYTASSLEDSIKLVLTDEAKAYRSKVSEWLSAFSEQDYDNMQVIEDDIVKAQKAMKFKGIIENIGKICATSGVIATVLTPFLPTAGVVSAIATFVGLPTAFFDPTKKYLWASFGVHDR